MKQLKRIMIAFAVLALASVTGCAGTATHTGEYVDDTVITTKVKAALFKEPDLKSAEINVETYKGQVQLSGFVSSRYSMNRAVDITRGVAGVQSVKDNMRLKN